MTKYRAASIVTDCVTLTMKSFARELDELGIVCDKDQREKVIKKLQECLIEASSCAVTVHALVNYENDVNESEETLEDIEKELSHYAESKPNSGTSHDVIMNHFVNRVQAAQKRTKKGTKQHG